MRRHLLVESARCATRRGSRNSSEKKRAAIVAELTAKGCELRHAQEAVAGAEQVRLERIARKRAQPMEADAAPGEPMEADAAPGQPMEADAAPGLGVCPAGTPPALPAR